MQANLIFKLAKKKNIILFDLWCGMTDKCDCDIWVWNTCVGITPNDDCRLSFREKLNYI